MQWLTARLVAVSGKLANITINKDSISLLIDNLIYFVLILLILLKLKTYY